MNDAVSPSLSTPASAAEQVILLTRENADLRQQLKSLTQQLHWLKGQVFGEKSEKRLLQDARQLGFDALLGDAPATPPAPTVEITYQRGTAKKQRADTVNDSGLRFTAEVPVEVIELTPPELQGAEADQYEIIGTKTTHRVAQRTSTYTILQYQRPVLKRKDTQAILPTPAPGNVLDGSVADVSLLVGLLVDKFQYHLPLYRQHQRLAQAGITLSRASLTTWVKRAIELLRPVVAAQLAHVLESQVLAMDETPIKASREKPGSMKQGWFWPLYGEDDEVVFTYSTSRGQQHIRQTLQNHFKGTLLTDGYGAYAAYLNKTEGITHAQCWVHARRKLLAAEPYAPEAVAQALEQIGALYALEAKSREQGLEGEAQQAQKHAFRQTHSKPRVDEFFAWCAAQYQHSQQRGNTDWGKALQYVLTREVQLRVFLDNPAVAMDTNHLEREIRPIAVGRRSWLFCWTELGAEHVGIIQSLISTCKLHDINPTTYLMDVLQRVSQHPAKDIVELTPRRWKEIFAANPLRSDLDRKIR